LLLCLMSACVYQTGEVHDLGVDCKKKKSRERLLKC
jgi:hypothetical protein